jgi:hypothetical protein
MSFGQNNNDDELLTSKIQSEIDYLETSIVSMLNSVNNLSFQNYNVSSEKIEGGSEEIANEGESTSNSESSENGQGSKQQQSSSNSEENNYQYKMVENATLLGEKNTNWDELAYNIEVLNSAWATITIDLYTKNIDGQSILGFTSDLSNTIKAIKIKNKTETLSYLAKLYSYLPIYEKNISNNLEQANLYDVKACIYNAYAIIEQDNNEEVKKQLETAEDYLVSIMNNIDINKKEFNLNKVYVLLKDLQTSVELNDTDIFYLKYKPLYEEINKFILEQKGNE